MSSNLSLVGAVDAALKLAARKGMGVYVMRDVRSGDGFVASLFCDHCPTAVVGVCLPDGSYHNYS